jgi:hypothetical protein
MKIAWLRRIVQWGVSRLGLRFVLAPQNKRDGRLPCWNVYCNSQRVLLQGQIVTRRLVRKTLTFRLEVDLSVQARLYAVEGSPSIATLLKHRMGEIPVRTDVVEWSGGFVAVDCPRAASRTCLNAAVWAI